MDIMLEATNEYSDDDVPETGEPDGGGLVETGIITDVVGIVGECSGCAPVGTPDANSMSVPVG